MNFGRPKGILIAAAAVALLLIAATAVIAAPRDDSQQIERLRAVERERLAALVDVDMDVIEALHAPDFVLVPPPGFPLTRGEYLAAVASGDINYRTFEPVTEIDVRFYGNAAVLTYRSFIDIEAGGVGSFQQEVWHTYVYERTQGGWWLVLEQATGVGGFPPPGQ